MSDTRKLKNFEFGNATDTGRAREHNEDYLAYFETINGHVFVICDGMGGHAGGATAAQTAVEVVKEFLWNHYFDLPEDALREAITEANNVIYSRSIENPELSGMGTTIVLIIIRNDKIWYAHVGDSRIYFHSEGTLYRLTSDHSFVQSLVDQGDISEEEMELHPRRNEILQALGIKQDIEISICPAPAVPVNGDSILMCSDGLNSMINSSHIEAILNDTELSIQHKALRLVESANEAGGSDNITLQLIYFYNVANLKTSFSLPKHGKKSRKHQTKEPKKTKEKSATSDSNDEAKSKKAKIITYAIIAAIVLLLIYIAYDLFFSPVKSPENITLGPNDTTVVTSNDSSSSSSNNNSNNNINNNNNVNIPASTDTIWITYTVKSGDVLGKIATKYNVSSKIIKRKNKMKNDIIRVDQKLQVPVRAKYKVKANDVISNIAKKYNSSEEAVKKANGLGNSVLKEGQEICIPF